MKTTLTLFAFGKLKHPGTAALSDDYLQRIRRFHSLAVEELPDKPVSQPELAPQLLRQEAELLRKRIPAGSWIVALDERGTTLRSQELAKKLDTWLQAPNRPIAWVLGSAHGLDASWKDETNFRLSLSALTLPHQLARVLLLEQIYRAFSILKNHPYHNE